MPADVTMIEPTTRVTVSPRVYARAFGDEMVLLDFGVGEYFGLDPIGTEVWKRLEAGDPLLQIVDALVERYEVSRDDALRDVLALVSEMVDQGLVVAEAA